MKYNKKIKNIGRDIKKTLYSTYTAGGVDKFLEECTEEEFTKFHEELKGIEDKLKIALKDSRKKRFAEVCGGLALGTIGGYFFYNAFKTYSYIGSLVTNPQAHASEQYSYGIVDALGMSLFLGIANVGLGVLVAQFAFFDDSKNQAIKEVVLPQICKLEDTVKKYSK